MVDIEREVRAELLAILSPHFETYEEVNLSSPLLPDIVLRADVVAVTRDASENYHAFAFEVKCISEEEDSSVWAEAICQAKDYVGATISDKRFTSKIPNRISCAFLYPSPPYVYSFNQIPQVNAKSASAYLRICGMFFLATHLRVGRSYWYGKGTHRKFVLSIGTHDIWDSVEGFRKWERGCCLQYVDLVRKEDV